MAGSGVFLSLVAILGLWFNNKKKTLMEMNWLLRVIAFCTFVPFIANTAGWLITELGRYPWTVYGVFTIADSVSPNVSTTSLLISNIIYFCLFSGLGAVMVYLVKKEMDKGPYHELESQDHDSKANVDPFEKGAFGDE